VSEYRKRRRELERQIDEVDGRWQSRLANKEDHELFSLARSQYLFERSYPEIDLEKLETKRLVDQAIRLGVPFPEDDEWEHDTRTIREGMIIETYLLPPARTAFSARLSQARRHLVKDWVAIVAPILTVTFSLVALIVSIIALYKSR